MAEDCYGCDALFEGIPKGCDNNLPGLRKAYFTEKCNVASLTLSSPGDEIGTITMTGATLFYEFVFNKKTSTWTEVATFDPATGSTTYVQTLTIKLARREKTKRDTLALIGKFKDLACVVEDNNGLRWYLGEENGVNLTENNSETGTTPADTNGYTLTFVGEEPEAANTVTAAALAAVI